MRSLIILALIVLVPVGVYYYFTLSFQNSNSEEVLAKSSVETNTQPSLEEVSTTSDKINEIDNITPELVNEASGTETSNRITVVDGSEEVVDSIVPSVTTASTATPINNKKEIAKRVLSGEISLDDLEKMDTDLEMSDFVEVLEFRKTPVPLKAGTAVKSTSEHVKGMGINIETGDDSILSLYAYGVNNDYTGHILIPQEDGTRFGFKVENIPATSIGGLGGDVSISVMPNKGSVTIFMVGEQAKIANLRHWVMNDLDNMVQLSFPVSSRTRGSVTI